VGVRRLALYFVTGSSGSGKTTLVRRVVTEVYPALRAFHVDDPGVKDHARAWIEHAAKGPEELLVVEGQERPHVVLAAARDLGIRAVNVVLIDCGHAERRRRLLDERKQPELDRLDVYAWAAYLRGQADALGLEIIDTTEKSVAESANVLAASIGRFARRSGHAP
jgi:hypothetical protein